jgi:polysaccharide biosynthesis/export protein
MLKTAKRTLLDHMFAWFSVLSLSILLVGCSGIGYPPAPRKAATPEYNYKIGPLDTLHVIVWRNPDLTDTVKVRPDGKITVPLVEDLPALGKNSTELARDVEKALSNYIRDPVVTVVVSEFGGPYSEQIRVLGEAAKPQALPYRQNMTLVDVMILVGGVTEFADGNRASLLRTSEGSKIYGLRIDDLLKKGDLTANVDVKPGDVLVIPESWF